MRPDEARLIESSLVQLERVVHQDRARLDEIQELELLLYGRQGLDRWVLAPAALFGRVYRGFVGSDPAKAETVAWCILAAARTAQGEGYHVMSFAVVKAVWRQGVAGRFARLVKADLAASGNGTVWAFVAPTDAIGLHLARQSLGMATVESLPDWFGEGETRHLMAGSYGQ